MDETTRREWAEQFIYDHNAEYEFCLVYENEELQDELADLSDEEREKIERHIHGLMYDANVTVSWDDK